MRSHDSAEPVRVRASEPSLRRLAPSLLALALGTASLGAHAQARDLPAAGATDGPVAATAALPGDPAPTPVVAATDDAAPAVDPALDETSAGDTAPAAVAPPSSDATGDAPSPAAQQDAGASPPADTPAGTVPTEAEQDFQALYGVPSDAMADPTLPPPAAINGAYDPWEPYNRRMHRFNNVVDRRVARPLARAYVAVVPRPVRLGVSNFFNNLGQPVSAVNALLQGKPKQAAQSLGRFALNTTLGIGGIFDPASDANLPNRSEDFGQTLGVWGWKRSRYLELPLFGPRTLRDVVGMVGDAPLSPLRQVDADRVRVPIQGLHLVDIRAQLLSTDSLREGATDDYALLRDAWSQRRHYQIFGDRESEGETDLPDYLLDDSLPTVPVDAMPVMPTGGG